jgi:hypothetical protein
MKLVSRRACIASCRPALRVQRHIDTRTAQPAAVKQDAAFDELCSWIDFYGGYVHDKLDVGVSPSLGCRYVPLHAHALACCFRGNTASGVVSLPWLQMSRPLMLKGIMVRRAVVATERLSAAEQLHAPCMAIPQSLEVSADVAAQELDRMLAAVGLQGVARLQPEVVIGLFLAYERTRGVRLRIADALVSIFARDHVCHVMRCTVCPMSCRMELCAIGDHQPVGVGLRPPALPSVFAACGRRHSAAPAPQRRWSDSAPPPHITPRGPPLHSSWAPAQAASPASAPTSPRCLRPRRAASCCRRPRRPRGLRGPSRRGPYQSGPSCCHT